MLIKILGTGCPKCKLLHKTVEDAIKTLGREAEIEKVEDMQEIAEYGIMALPALIVDDMLVIAGGVPQAEELVDILQDISDHEGHECCGGGGCGDDEGCCGGCHCE